MTQIFAIFSNLNLIKKPVWFDEFRKKYDKPYKLHITLRSPCFVDDSNIDGLKEDISNIFSTIKIKNHKLVIYFNQIVEIKGEKLTIMLKANCPELIKIQRKLFESLRGYSKFVKDKYRIYGEKFEPHITIGRDIEPEEYGNVLQYLKNDFELSGEITELVFVIVKEDTPKESKNPLNQVVYKL